MNRREFFGRIVGAVGLLAVAPSVKLPPPVQKTVQNSTVYNYMSYDLETSMAEAAGRRVAEEVERQILGIETTTMHNAMWCTFRPSHIKEQA